MEQKKYVLLAEWGLSDGIRGLFPRVLEYSDLSFNCSNACYVIFAGCLDEAIEKFIKVGRIKRRKEAVPVNINGADEPSFYQFTDSIKYLAR